MSAPRRPFLYVRAEVNGWLTVAAFGLASFPVAACSTGGATENPVSDAGADARAGAGGDGSAAGGSASGGTGSGGTGSGGTGSGGTGSGGAGSGGTGSGGANAGGAGGSGTGGTGTGGTGAGGSGTTCNPACEFGLECCEGRCINPSNDILNCGGCKRACAAGSLYCDGGTCGAPPCFGEACGGGTFCCGAQCCSAGQLCCTVNAGPSLTQCTDPVDGTCPVGCPGCVCASPDTPLATPSGAVPIAALRVGDLVWSVHAGEVRAVPLVRVHREPVSEHQVIRLTFDGGASFDMSPGHPTADGRTLADVTAGELLGGTLVVRREVLAYPYAHTYDVLPDSDTGTYFASGVLVGSTLHERVTTGASGP